jgi:PAS domain S-box-containing protein
MDDDPQAEFVRALVDALPAMVAYWDSTLRCRFANRAYQKWFGVDPDTMVGRDMKEFLGPLFALNRPYIEGALRGEEQEFEREIPDPAGGPARHSQAHYIPDVVDGTVRGFSVLVADITRRKRAEEALHQMERQLRATERLAAMATLAAGIAHEINNPLAAVVANVELLLERIESGHSDPASFQGVLGEVRDAAARIRDIVRSMKLLARGDTATRAVVDLNETLERSVALAANTIRYKAHLVRDFAQQGLYVDGNAAQLTQVFMSLLVNAAQALGDTPALNEIRLTSRREDDHIVVEVRDNGCGIPDELKARIFEPFFTTKHESGGMGLGLSISSGIVNAFGGTISVTSNVGQGSVFRVVLPAARAPAVLPQAATSIGIKDGLLSTASGSHARLLIIDDEEIVARTLQRALAEDHDVVVVTRGRDAVAALTEDNGTPFDLILCDLMMPEMSGEDVYAEVTRRRPDLARRFVFMTGGPFTTRGRQFLGSVDAPVIDKPFDVAIVRAMVRSLAR